MSFKYTFLGLNRKIIKNSGFAIDIVSMNDELFWVSQDSTNLNWMNTNNDEKSSRVLDIGNSSFNQYYVHNII